MANTITNKSGQIISIKGQVVEVEFLSYQPTIHNILIHPKNKAIKLEVYSSNQKNSYFCLSLTSNTLLHIGMKVTDSGKQFEIPTGSQILGRVIDIFGKTHDIGKSLQPTPSLPIYQRHSTDLQKILIPSKIIETGIKAIDFFCPILEGGKVGLFGGAGVGKTIVLTELINNLLLKNKQAKDTLAVFSAVGERSREAQELYQHLKNTKAFQQLTLILGQMGENPVVRSRTAFAGASLATYLRDHFKKRVIFFMDNAYRFAQAGHELSILLNSIPSEDGYQPTLHSEMGQLHDRLTSTLSGSITAIEAVFVPSDDMTDQGVRAIFPYLDTFVILSRSIYQQGRLPAIDLLASTSIALNKSMVSSSHYNTYLKAKNLLEQAASLEKIVSLIGFSELSYENQIIYKRSLLLQNYMTQNLFTIESQTNKKGQYVPLTKTIQTVQEIIAGNYDAQDPEKIKS